MILNFQEDMEVVATAADERSVPEGDGIQTGCINYGFKYATW